MLRTDLLDRGVPWMRLLLQEGKLSQRKSLNLKTIEKVNTAFIGLALLALAYAGLRRDVRGLVVAALLVAPVLVANLPLYGFFRRERGLWFALRIVPLNLAYYVLNGLSAVLGWCLHHLIGAPAPAPEVQAFTEVGVKRWPPLPAKAKGSVWLRPGE